MWKKERKKKEVKDTSRREGGGGLKNEHGGGSEKGGGTDRSRKETSDVVCPIAITPSGTFLRQRQNVLRKSLKCIAVGSGHCELRDCNIRISSD